MNLPILVFYIQIMLEWDLQNRLPINLSKAIKEENNGLLGDYDGDGRIDLITKDLNGINRIHFIAKNQYNVNLGIGDIDFQA